MLTGIQAIIWDFDGVLNTAASTHEFGWTQHLKDAFGIDPPSFRAALFNKDFSPCVEPGKVDLFDHIKAINTGFFDPERTEEFVAFWFKVSITLDEEMISITRTLADRGYSPHLGTNNEPHRASHIWESVGMKAHMRNLFTSGQLGVRKPDIEYFQFIEHSLNLPASSLILIDDDKDNVAGALAAGWQAYLFSSKKAFKRDFTMTSL